MSLARECIDLAAQSVKLNPAHFQAFATLASPAPHAAARELERCVRVHGFRGALVCGRTRDRNVDAPEFIPIFEAVNHLNVPVYIHAQIPQNAERQVYYSGLGEQVDLPALDGWLGLARRDWIQVMRLILFGLLDRLPKLQLILGHWGEVIHFYLDRIDDLSVRLRSTKRRVSEYGR